MPKTLNSISPRENLKFNLLLHYIQSNCLNFTDYRKLTEFLEVYDYVLPANRSLLPSLEEYILSILPTDNSSTGRAFKLWDIVSLLVVQLDGEEQIRFLEFLLQIQIDLEKELK